MASRRQLNPSVKARRSRVYRKPRKEERRFDSPLKEFIEIKYNTIYEEYSTLYKKMIKENPYKIDLKKSKTFIQWKRDQLNSNVLSQAISETINNEAGEPNEDTENTEVSEANNTFDNTEFQDEGMLAAQQVDELINAMNMDDDLRLDEGMLAAQQVDELINAMNMDNDLRLDEGMLAAQQVDELVNAMNMDDDLRDILERETEDEGIELSIEEEIDIEPFDYNLEVETLHW